MNLICPECKNTVDLNPYTELQTGTVVECHMCGITLKLTGNDGTVWAAEIMDEGK